MIKSLKGLKPSVTTGFKGYWGSLGRDIVVSISTSKGSAFRIYPVSIDLIAQRDSKILVNIFRRQKISRYLLGKYEESKEVEVTTQSC